MRLIFEAKILIYQTTADSDEKISFWQNQTFVTPKNQKNASKGFISRIPRSILVHDLCGIEVYIASLRNGIRISIQGKSWT